MSVIHRTSVALGCRSAFSDGTARNSTLRSITTSMQGNMRATTPSHSRRPARGGVGARAFMPHGRGGDAKLIAPDLMARATRRRVDPPARGDAPACALAAAEHRGPEVELV